MINKARIVKCTVFKNALCGEREREIDASLHYGGRRSLTK
jgi:hypothetical protein